MRAVVITQVWSQPHLSKGVGMFLIDDNLHEKHHYL